MRSTFNVLFYIVAFIGCTCSIFSQNTDIARKYYNEAHTHNLRQEYKEAAEDYSKAAEEYLKAAELGDISSQNRMGELYATGKGVKKDLKQAFAWYKKAADQGDDHSQFMLGCIYEAGDGVEKNLDEAARWFFKAAAQGYKINQARERYDHVIKMGATPPADLLEADKNAKEDRFWKKSATSVPNWTMAKFGWIGIIMIFVIAVVALILLGRFDRKLSDEKKINIWVSPVLFAVGALILKATSGFYAPGIEKFVDVLMAIALLYQSFQIIRTSKSFPSIVARIALTYVVSVCSFYATATVVVLFPIIVAVLFVRHIVTHQSTGGAYQSASEPNLSDTSGNKQCRACSRYPGHGSYCDYANRQVGDITKVNCPFYLS